MTKTAAMVAAVSAAAWLTGAAPALAQRNDGIDNAPDQQRIADAFRAAGSKCDAPACHNTAEGVYPPSTGPGATARTPSISAGQPQPSE